MRTTLDIDDKLLADVVKITGEKSKSKAVNKALEEYIQKIKVQQLKELSGKVKMVDTWKNLRKMELNE
ncbi:type II toxin-antitoxin system VapB family antitoxin [Candidatus Aerophobetes bacterium]|nr:type II toxin-antitoxin system VapB family antitoxin [Candidatus Aerophobetes bacterium]